MKAAPVLSFINVTLLYFIRRVGYLGFFSVSLLFISYLKFLKPGCCIACLPGFLVSPITRIFAPMEASANTYHELITEIAQRCERTIGHPLWYTIDIHTSDLDVIIQSLSRLGLQIQFRRSYNGVASFWFPRLADIENRLLHKYPWLFRSHIVRVGITPEKLKEIYSLYIIFKSQDHEKV